MDRVVDRPGALDVHKEQVTACVRVPDEDGRSRHQAVQEFKTTVRGLLGMSDEGARVARLGYLSGWDCPRICVGMIELESRVYFNEEIK